MKKSYLLFIAAGLCCLAACNKEVEIPQETAGPIAPVKMITETISANFGHETKVTIDGSGTFAWTAGDNIAVHVSKGDTHKYVLTSDDGASGASLAASSASFTVVYEEGYARDAFAVYPSAIVATDAVNYGQSGSALDITLPSSYTLAQVGGETTPSPMIADNTGSGWEFKHLCGLLRLTVSNIPAEATKLKIDFNGRKVSGAFSVSATVTAGSSTIASVAGTKGSDDYIMITEIGDDDEVTITLPLPTGTAYSDLIVSAWNEDVALKAQVTPFSYTASNARGKKLTSALTLGAFSRAAGKYIVFAPGNLQATISGYSSPIATASSWRFAEKQYEFLAKGRDVMASGVGTVDLFTWQGTSSSVGPHFGLCTDTSFPVNTALYGTGTALEKDWGALAISYGSSIYVSNTWRTPIGGPSGEWKYILESRSTDNTINSKSNARFVKVRIKAINQNGLILFPDHYYHSSSIATDLSATINCTEEYPWDYVVQPTQGEVDTMIDNGAVFIPNGDAWSKTGYNSADSYALMTSNYVSSANAIHKYVQEPVRLVRDLN